MTQARELQAIVGLATPMAVRVAATLGLVDRAGRTGATAVAGSFFDPLPTGGDAYLLADILHDWGDANAAAILARCAEAADPGGVVLVIEPILGKGVDTSMDLFMLMCFGGRERPVDDLTRLAAGCGLVLRASVDVADGRTLLEFGCVNA